MGPVALDVVSLPAPTPGSSSAIRLDRENSFLASTLCRSRNEESHEGYESKPEPGAS
jgi:hypothetical protein